MKFHPVLMIILGFLLLLAGWILPLLMVMHVLPSTFFLNFFSYTVSLIGLIMGFVGVVYYARFWKK
jgi:hypothetical protein